jgi:hypothetical protein
VQDATKTARQAQFKAAVAKALAAGRITQDHADWLNQGIDNGWIGNRQLAGMAMGMGMNGFGNSGLEMGRIMGMGPGMGMRGQHFMNRQGQKQPQDQPNSSNGSSN